MEEFKQYRRTQIAEMRPVTKEEIELGRLIIAKTRSRKAISVSAPDLENGSPKIGDMIARNPKNHEDQWLVAEQYFKDNFEELNNK
jgi:BMFP domain-containing protein YqiC